MCLELLTATSFFLLIYYENSLSVKKCQTDKFY